MYYMTRDVSVEIYSDENCYQKDEECRKMLLELYRKFNSDRKCY